MKIFPFLSLFLLIASSAVCDPLNQAQSIEAEHAQKETAVNRIIFLMQAGKLTEAFKAYRKHYEEIGHHDIEVVQKIGLILLDQGFRSGDSEVQLLTLYGAGISMNEKVLYILEDGIKSATPQVQLVAMSSLARFQDDRADQSLKRALASEYLLIRLEGAYLLAERGVPSALGQTQSLMSKIDREFLPIFPKIYAKIGTPDAMKVLKRLMNNSNEKVRISAILSAAESGRDDLLPSIRKLSTQHTTLQQEACAKALGILKDETSVAKLKELAQVHSASVRLAALEALYTLGRHEVRADVEEIAKKNNLFAIHLLGTMPGSEVTLNELLSSCDIQVRVNAALALLDRQDIRSLPIIAQLLVKDSRDLGVVPISSAGGALKAFRVVPSITQNENEMLEELSLQNREEILIKTELLQESAVLQIAQLIFDRQQNDLIPALMHLLVKFQSPASIELLKKYQLKAGAPLIRNYCCLALFKLKEPGPYQEEIQKWASKEHQEDFIRFRPLLPWDVEPESGPFGLTPQETSSLLIETFETFAESREDEGINVLLHAIQHGNPKNKYVLAGLLLRAS